MPPLGRNCIEIGGGQSWTVAFDPAFRWNRSNYLSATCSVVAANVVTMFLVRTDLLANAAAFEAAGLTVPCGACQDDPEQRSWVTVGSPENQLSVR